MMENWRSLFFTGMVDGPSTPHSNISAIKLAIRSLAVPQVNHVHPIMQAGSQSPTGNTMPG